MAHAPGPGRGGRPGDWCARGAEGPCQTLACRHPNADLQVPNLERNNRTEGKRIANSPLCARWPSCMPSSRPRSLASATTSPCGRCLCFLGVRPRAGIRPARWGEGMWGVAKTRTGVRKNGCPGEPVRVSSRSRTRRRRTRIRRQRWHSDRRLAGSASRAPGHRCPGPQSPGRQSSVGHPRDWRRSG